MNVSFYSAYSAMQAYQKGLDVVANNLANVSTVGYKEVRSNFSDLVYTKLDQHGDHTMLSGHGVKLDQLTTVFEQGNFQTTDYSLDFALTNDGFFASQVGDNAASFTRDGSFRLGEEDGVFYLTRNDGSFVLDQDMERIEISYDKESNVADLEGLVDRIGVFRFNNPYELGRTENNAYLANEVTGDPIAVEGSGRLMLQGALETSSANMSDGMLAMMENQRAFQLNARMLQAADQVEEMVNNLR